MVKEETRKLGATEVRRVPMASRQCFFEPGLYGAPP
jgi:hypothetical protein